MLFEAELRALLGIPDTHSVVCMIPLAYTRGTDFAPAPRRPVDDITYVDHWGTQFSSFEVLTLARRAPVGRYPARYVSGYLHPRPDAGIGVTVTARP